MTEPNVPPPPLRPLDARGTYPCPVCRRGQISPIALMEVFGCDTCHHILSVNLPQQCATVSDTSPPQHWRWDGQRWHPTYRQGVEVNGWVWLAAIAFILFPTGVVGIAAYIFPPLPDSPFVWFPIFWTGLTFFCHLACVVWLIGEYFQIPLRPRSRNRRYRTTLIRN
jgi:hypothetical protein